MSFLSRRFLKGAIQKFCQVKPSGSKALIGIQESSAGAASSNLTEITRYMQQNPEDKQS